MLVIVQFFSPESLSLSLFLSRARFSLSLSRPLKRRRNLFGQCHGSQPPKSVRRGRGTRSFTLHAAPPGLSERASECEPGQQPAEPPPQEAKAKQSKAKRRLTPTTEATREGERKTGRAIKPPPPPPQLLNFGASFYVCTGWTTDGSRMDLHITAE